MTPGDRCSVKNFIVLDKPVPAPQRNAVSPKSVIAGHGAASQQRRNPVKLVSTTAVADSGECFSKRVG